jgi:peptide chain release factor 1
MFDKLQDIATQYQTLQHKLYDPEVLGDVTQLTQINRKITSMQELYDTYQQYQKCHHAQQEAKAILETEEDPDLIQMAQEQRDQANQQMPLLEQQLKILMLPKDPNDDKNIFLEIRPAAGGDEAGLFGSELLKMYMMYAQSQWWKAEIIEHILNDVWWLKFAMIKINGNKVYSIMKYESGVHRVQRIPATETNGRVHTSTVTVAIMPEAEEIDFHIDPKEVEMDTYAASSAGGQNANKNQTGVRLRHLPTGMMVNIWDSKSQMANKEKARAVLRARLYQIHQDKQQAQTKDLRGSQIGTWERSEKIRTYNYPQDRVTDHRIHQSRSNLPVIMMGQIDHIIHDVILYFQTQQLQSHSQH